MFVIPQEKERAMKKYEVNITAMLTIDAESKKEAIKAAFDRVECIGEVNYYITANESPPGNSPDDAPSDVLKEVEKEIGIS